MRNRVHGWMLPVLAALFAASFVAPERAVAQAGGTIQVLVAPLQTGAGVDQGFGEDVAEKVREALEDFSGMQPVEEDAVEDALKQFQLDARQMNLIQWRQLAGRLNAQLVMFGTAERGGQGIQVDVTFVDPKSGDELPVEAFSVADDGRDEEAAGQITAGLEQQVAYQRSVLFCQEYLGSSQLEDALRNCNQALETNPNSTRALYLRGRVHMEAGDHQAAVDDLETVVEENASNTEALQSLAYAHAQIGNKERAQELYQEYLTFQPDDAQVRLNVAFNLAQAGAFGEAMTILQEGVERDSTNAALWEYLGNVALAQGTARQNGAASDTTAGSPPGDAAAVTDTAAVQVAVRAFDKVMTLKGDSVAASVLTNAIAAHLQLGELQEALDFSDRALQTLRASGPASGSSATAATDSLPAGEEVPGGAAESREELRARIHSLRADIFAKQEQLGRAIQEMDQVIQIQREQRALMKRGFFKLRNGNTEGAITDYRAAIEGGADRNAVANQLFGTGYNDYFQKGQYSTAIDMFRTALEFAQEPQLQNQINFFSAYGYYQMGTALDSRNEAQEACQPARQALNAFQQVNTYLGRAGGYQANSQAQIREATDVQLYRQEQIIRKSCQ